MLFVILDFKHLCDMSRFFNIPRFRVILKCIRNYPKVRKCRNEAIRVKELGYYDKVPGQLGLVNDIIKNPEKHFKEFSEYGDIDSYIDYVIYPFESEEEFVLWTNSRWIL